MPVNYFLKKIILTGLLYFIAAFTLLGIFGIQTGGEAEKYIDNANRILQGRELRNGFFGLFYVVYSAVVALFVWLNINLVFVALVQIVLSFIAALCLYKLILKCWQQQSLAFIFFIIYLLCYPIQKWNFYLYSDGLHTSLLVIGMYTFYRLLQTPNRVHGFSFMLMLLLIIFSRPTGLVFALAAFFVLLVWLHKRKQKLAFYGVLAGGIVAAVMLVNSPLTAFVNPDSIKRLEVICQVPETTADTAYNEFNRAGLAKAFAVIKDEVGIGNFMQTGFKKLGYFFGMYRSYYSWQNNLLLLCFTLLYPLMLIGVFKKPAQSFYYAWLFSVLYILLSASAIFFTCDDWANRFISPVFPFVLILAAGGILRIFQKMEFN